MATNKPTKPKTEKKRFITPIFRVSYLHLFTPSELGGKYQIVMLVPKNTEDIKQYQKELHRVKVEAFGPDKNKWPKLKGPISDGDNPKYADKKGYKGHWVVKATSMAEAKPQVIDRDKTPIENASDFYAGCYARACIFARVWEYMGAQGTQFILEHVQKYKDGEAFGSKKSADQVFDPLEGEGEDSGSESDSSDDSYEEDES